jgi:hypothetical protein
MEKKQSLKKGRHGGQSLAMLILFRQSRHAYSEPSRLEFLVVNGNLNAEPYN